MEIYCSGSTKAISYAAAYLHSAGWDIADQPSETVRCLLLDVPLRSAAGVEKLLAQLPLDVTVCAGNADFPGYRVIDLLKDEQYLAQNAYITAECALDAALPYLTITLRNCPVLIVGWGRIGKCLGQLLHAMGAEVTIAARKETDRAMIRALGFSAADTAGLDPLLPGFRLIYNTVPQPVLKKAQMALCREDCVKIDLASKSGIEDDDVITARGLPGIHFPESSGRLIAESILRLI